MQRVQWGVFGVLVLVIALLAGGEWRAVRGDGTLNLILQIQDEFGRQVGSGVRVVRHADAGIDRYGPLIDVRTPDAGIVGYWNIPNEVYRIDVLNIDDGAEESWIYRTYFRTPVPSGGTYRYTIRREKPYLWAVDVGAGMVMLGQPVSVTVSIRDGYVMSFDQQTWLEVTLDRDQAAPYDLMTNAGPWPPHSPITTTLTFTPSVAGLYYVRPIVRQRWQNGGNVAITVTDEGWWRWTVQVVEPFTATPTPSPTATETPLPTPPPSATPTMTGTATPTATATPSARPSIHLPCVLKAAGV